MNKMSDLKLETSLSTTDLEKLESWFDMQFERKMQEKEKQHIPSLALIATKGTLDWAYPPFILASTAAALGWKVSVFFTFYGLLLLKKDIDLKVSPLGNPAMPMKMPAGPEWFQKMNWPVPNAVPSLIPGFENAATALMKKTFANKGVATIDELRELSIEAEVKMYGCQMTVDTFGFTQKDFIEEAEFCGAATFLPEAQKSDVTLFV